ncbi:MAG: U32 family peptidase [Parcubacteria group bacterium]|jgi:putative protease
MKKTELLAPAGSPEKLKYAIQYEADAVYCGLPDFSMRRRINSFSEKTLAEAVKFAHARKKKIYVTVNTYPHNDQFTLIAKHLKFLAKIKPDAIIISDPGVLELAKKNAPGIPVHLSTQANAINWQAVKFWAAQGVERVILAREVTLAEIKEIHEKVPEVELECFVHGAMCMSYSGRCILSAWMTGRSANLGDCAQPCRWKYGRVTHNVERETLLMSIEDEKKKFEIDLEEDKNGTYFFNSQDMNLLEHLDKLKKAGIISFKIEGRNKSVYYVATVCRAYRKVLDALAKKVVAKKLKKIIEDQQKELGKLMHRGYTNGFLFGHDPKHDFKKSHKKCDYEFVGEVVESWGKTLTVQVHNAINLKDKIEVIDPNKNTPIKIKKIFNQDKKEVKSAHGGHDQLYFFKIDKEKIKQGALLRRVVKMIKTS